jgi:hypothetical protein
MHGFIQMLAITIFVGYLLFFSCDQELSKAKFTFCIPSFSSNLYSYILLRYIMIDFNMLELG